MTVFLDARIPVVFGGEPGPLDAVLAASGEASHAAGCTCCVGRSPDAARLDQLFLQRVKGEVPWFTRVVIVGDGGPVGAEIVADPVLSARFRLVATA